MKNIPIWTEREIEDRAIKIMDFLVQMHPFLEKGSPRRDCVELRPIYRGPKKDKEFVSSMTIWNSKRSKDFLKSFLRKINGKSIDAYFSVYAFDYDFKARERGGHKYYKGRVNNQNAQFTQIIPMDFDNISYNDHKKQIERLASAGIKVSTIYTGYGYHDHILLDKPYEDKNLIAFFTKLFLQKGFPVDQEIRDAARIMRLPYTNNCKAFDPTLRNYYSPNPKAIPTEIVSISSTRYSLEDVIYAISALPDTKLKTKKCKVVDDEAVNKPAIQIQKKETPNNNASLKRMDPHIAYREYLRWGTLPPHIQRMLDCTRRGFRNSVILYLVPYFRNSRRFDLEKIKSIMSIWATRCEPALDVDFVQDEVIRIYLYNLEGPWGKYTDDMEEEFGPQKFPGKYSRENQVQIPHDFIRAYSNMPDTSVKIYLSMLCNESARDTSEWSAKEICSVANISRDSFDRNIKKLVDDGFIDKKRSNKKAGKSYSYYINRFARRDKGFVALERSTLDKSIRELTSGELKLYTYILHLVGVNNEPCFASQATLGKKIGKKQSSISQMTNSLQAKGFIKKEILQEDSISYCNYKLLY